MASPNPDYSHYAPLQSISERAQGENQRRILCGLDSCLYQEAKIKDSAIISLYGYWNQKRQNGGNPKFETFVPKNDLAQPISRWISFVDMSEDYPPNFVVSDHIGFALGDFSGKRLIEHDSRAHACATVAEYQTMKSFPQPMAHVIDQRISTSLGVLDRSYLRLMLPLESSNPSEFRIVYAMRYLRMPSSTADSARKFVR